jgi:transcriptional repressor NrdR
VRCPSCDHAEDRVVDSRTSRGGRAIRRRRECLGCSRRFTTYEHIEEEPLGVRKRTGASEPYDRAKLLGSIGTACAKRSVSLAEIEALVDGIEEELAAADTREVSSRDLGEMVMSRLRTVDQVAYVRFASVYRNFQDTTEFMEEVRELVRRARYQAAGQVDLFGLGEEPET